MEQLLVIVDPSLVLSFHLNMCLNVDLLLKLDHECLFELFVIFLKVFVVLEEGRSVVSAHRRPQGIRELIGETLRDVQIGLRPCELVVFVFVVQTTGVFDHDLLLRLQLLYLSLVAVDHARLLEPLDEVGLLRLPLLEPIVHAVFVLTGLVARVLVARAILELLVLAVVTTVAVLVLVVLFGVLHLHALVVLTAARLIIISLCQHVLFE